MQRTQGLIQRSEHSSSLQSRETRCVSPTRPPLRFKLDFDLVRWEGVEPPTTWFVARYSIQLSYQRDKVGIIIMSRIQVNLNLQRLTNTFFEQDQNNPT